MITSQNGPEEERTLLMQEWVSIIQYWASDNNILWQRCSVFLVVNSILFTPLALVRSDSFLPIWIVRYMIPSLALFMNILWFFVNMRSVAAIRHFEQLVSQIREKILVLRFYNEHDRKSQFRHWYEKVEGKKHILPALPILFFVFWFVVLLVLLLN